jgi:hypothetical protein
MEPRTPYEAPCDRCDLTKEGHDAYDVSHVYEPMWEWLRSTVELQRDAYGFEVDDIPGHAAREAPVVKENALAAIVELVELLGEVKWKYWSHEEPWVRRGAVLEEAVDVMHFLANILTAIGVSDDELWEAYRAKQQRNRDRQAAKYVSRQAPSEASR